MRSTGLVGELADVPVVDNHCHSVERDQDHFDVARWRAYFTESTDLRTQEVGVATTAFYRRLVRELAERYDIDAGPDAEGDGVFVERALLAARGRHDVHALTGGLLRDAGVAGLVVDTGFPDAATALTVEEMAAAGGCRAGRLLRLEPTFERLVAVSQTLPDLLDAVRAELGDVRAQGWSGFKTVAGYRTGLAIGRWDRADAEAAFAGARAAVLTTGRVRLGHKPLLDTLLHLAFEAAAAAELPVQVHVGYGDTDADLRLAHPLLLRDVFEEPAYRGMPVVLLHGCWPYTREGAYLAAVYGNAWLDLSYAIPFLSRAELRRTTQAALGAAPVSRLLYSSDGARVPELHWMGARDGRRLIADALDELVRDGDLGVDQAVRSGRQILHDNAVGLYDLPIAS